MKLPFRLKYTLILTLLIMYTTGVITWVMTNWFLLNSGFGAEPSPLRTFWLQMHSIVSLWFLALFGYLFHAHVVPAWKKRKKKWSGGSLTAVLVFLCLTVPGLFYISNENFKSVVALIHTYVGISALGFFLIHLNSKR